MTKMDCETLAPALSEAAAGEVLDARLQGELEEHLGRCAACRMEDQALRALVGDLRMLPAQRVASPQDQRALAGVVAAVRAGLQPAPRPPYRRLRHRPALGAALSVAAAALLLVWLRATPVAVTPAPRVATPTADALLPAPEEPSVDAETAAFDWDDEDEPDELAETAPEPSDLNEILLSLSQDELVRVQQALKQGA